LGFRLQQPSISSSNDQQFLKSLDLLSEFVTASELFIDNIQDKVIAGIHQRKVNKMLATRIHDLEEQLSKMTDQLSTEINENKQKDLVRLSFDNNSDTTTSHQRQSTLIEKTPPRSSMAKLHAPLIPACSVGLISLPKSDHNNNNKNEEIDLLND
jgi:hypothetical protein